MRGFCGLRSDWSDAKMLPFTYVPPRITDIDLPAVDERAARFWRWESVSPEDCADDALCLDITPIEAWAGMVRAGLPDVRVRQLLKAMNSAFASARWPQV